MTEPDQDTSSFVTAASPAHHNAAANPASINPVAQVEPLYVFILGIFLLLTGLVLALTYQTPPPFPRVVITVLVGIGAAAIASGITGFLEFQSKLVRAGGPLDVLVFICIFVWESGGHD